MSVWAEPVKRIQYAQQRADLMQALVARVTNVSVREDKFLENQAIHGLKDRIEFSKLENHRLCLRTLYLVQYLTDHWSRSFGTPSDPRYALAPSKKHD